jgi:CBS-domain-containing membrane protein
MGDFELFDPAFRDNKLRYAGQCLIATLSVLATLLLLDTIEHTVTVASLGASTFIVFARPHHRQARPRALIGGYVIGTVSGCLCSVASAGLSSAPLPVANTTLQTLFGALAVGLAFFGMVALQSEHPPAAGLALGLVINGWDLRTLAVVILGISSLAVIKTLTKPLLIDLT